MTGDSFSPSFDPANRGNLAGVVKFVLTKFLQGVDDMLPAKVISYDPIAKRAQVQPLLSIVTTGGTQVQRAQVASVPVYQPSAGGFILHFPINPGDLGWIKANDGDISLFLKVLQNASPNTARLHSFEDALFYPDSMMRNVVIADEDADSVVLQNISGTGKIAIDPNGNVRIVAATTLTMTAPNVIINASDGITMNSPVTTFTGLIASTDGAGTSTFAGSIVVTGDVTAEGTSVHTHVHSGVMPGGGDTGPPV